MLSSNFSYYRKVVEVMTSSDCKKIISEWCENHPQEIANVLDGRIMIAEHYLDVSNSKHWFREFKRKESAMIHRKFCSDSYFSADIYTDLKDSIILKLAESQLTLLPTTSGTINK